MASIYEGAELTIVAAAGLDANYGLPGVGTTLRRPQPKIRLQPGSMLVSTLQDSRVQIPSAEWSSRGWTYQEGVLSNRKLVFTDHQVYWECRGMAIHESIYLPLHLVHERSGRRMENYMLSGVFQGNDDHRGYSTGGGVAVMHEGGDDLDYGFPLQSAGTLRSKLKGLDEHIRAFSARNLSYDQDSLTAFLGTAEKYSSYNDLRLFLGIPVWIGNINNGELGGCYTFALSIASWSHRNANQTDDLFTVNDCPRRRHLPSWTWAGWNGPVSM